MYLILFIVLIIIIFFIAGPRPKRARLPQKIKLPDIKGLENYIQARENKFENIKSHAKAEIVWSDEMTKTEYSILYLHGFTANKMETKPLTSNLASELGANVYFARISGHGRDPDNMGEFDASRWLLDAIEAYEIAKKIGEKVIVIGTSTGGTLAMFLANYFEDDTIYIMLSPNFGPKDRRAEALSLPWGNVLGYIMSGKYRWWKIQNEAHKRYWTCKFPTRSLLPMMALVKQARKFDFAKIKSPILIFYSEKDTVVEPNFTKNIYENLGSPKKKIIDIENSGDRDNHVLCGDALSPNTTSEIENYILEFIQKYDDNQ